MSSILISGGEIVNEGQRFIGYVLIENDIIADIGPGECRGDFRGTRIDSTGKTVIPGIIDGHVHFRDPGLTSKGNMESESAAAVAGGVTTVLEMPNTVPATTSAKELERKFESADGRMHTNYSFFLGATNDNLTQIKRLDLCHCCGVKLFMGSSTGNMLVDSEYSLSALFSEFAGTISTHCEDESMVRANTEFYRKRAGESADARIHPMVRTAESCYRSSARAVELADKYGTRLHVAHLTTQHELSLFSSTNYMDKKITAEVCIPHLWFTDDDYALLGNRIKCNPAIKSTSDRTALREALAIGKIDTVATDHAPHTLQEKELHYWEAPSGIPMVQHSLTVMMELVDRGVISPELMVEKMCHAPATVFRIAARGYLRKGYKADITIIGAEQWRVAPENILYRCGWSPLEGKVFGSRVTKTIINGRIVFDQGKFDPVPAGERLVFERAG